MKNTSDNYSTFSKELFKASSFFNQIDNTEFAKLSRPVLETYAQTLKTAEDVFLKLVTDARETLDVLADDHPGRSLAKANLNYAQTSATELSQLRQLIERFLYPKISKVDKHVSRSD